MHAKKIVVGYDHSPISQKALLWAGTLAAKASAALEAVFVFDPSIEKIRSLSLGEKFSVNLARKIEKEVEGLIDPKKAGRVEWSCHVEKGRPATVLIQRAKAYGADLLLVGTHGHTGYERALLGSVSERVLRRAPCPVWIHRPGKRDGVKKILVPVDLSEISLQVLGEAISWVQRFDASLVIFHVVDLSRYMPLPELDLFDVDFDPARITQERKDAFEDFITKAKARLPGLGKVEWRAQSAVGSPVEEIVDFAKQEGSDLVIMGSHERKVRKILLGSVAENIARYAPCSVLIAREKMLG